MHELRALRHAAGALGLALAVALIVRAEPGPDPEVPSALYARLGVSAELAQLPRDASAYLARNAVRIAPEDRRRLAQIIESGFRADRLDALAFESFLAHYEPGPARVALRWLAEDTVQDLYARGRRQRDVARSCDPGAEDAMSEEQRRLALRFALTGERVRALIRASSVFTELILAGSAALPAEQQVPAARLQQLVDRQHEVLQDGVSRAAREDACAYADVPVATLRDAVAFLDGESGRWMQSTVDRAIQSALRTAAASTAQQIARAFGRDPGLQRPLREARASLGGRQ